MLEPGSEVGQVPEASFRRVVEVYRAELYSKLLEHPTLLALEAYSRGDLVAEKREQLADHLAVCAECAILACYAVQVPETDEGIHKAEIEEGWVTLSARFEGPSLEGVRTRVVGEEELPETQIEEEISALYAEVSRLTLAKNPEGDDVVDEHLEKTIARLRDLQEAEAVKFQKTLEANLDSPIHAGKAILERARDLREDLEESLASLHIPAL